jgi:hypothetical protein
MASETFGIGFCFARHVATAIINSSVSPITFLTGCVAGRPSFSHAQLTFPDISYELASRWEALTSAPALSPSKDLDHAQLTVPANYMLAGPAIRRFNG